MIDPDELAQLPAELTYDDAPPLSDADLEAYGDAAVTAATDSGMDVEHVDYRELAAPRDLDGSTNAYAASVFVPEAVRRWRIEDDDAATWAMAKVAAIDVELAELTAGRESYTRRIGRWFDKSAKPLVARRMLLEGHLKDYARRERARDPKRKTVLLPTGRVSSRGGSAPSVKVADEDAVIAWAKTHLEGDELTAVVKVVESVRVSNLREHVAVGRLTVGLLCTATLTECACTVPELVMLEAPTTEGLTIEQRTALSPWALGEVIDCGLCGVARVVESIATELHQIDAVLDEAGAVVPGTIVEQPTTTFTVAPDA